jgi:hypothetical protein
MAGLDPAIHENERPGAIPAFFLSSLRGALATKQSGFAQVKLDCFAEPVIGRAFARPVGSQ